MPFLLKIVKENNVIIIFFINLHQKSRIMKIEEKTKSLIKAVKDEEGCLFAIVKGSNSAGICVEATSGEVRDMFANFMREASENDELLQVAKEMLEGIIIGKQYLSEEQLNAKYEEEDEDDDDDDIPEVVKSFLKGLKESIEKFKREEEANSQRSHRNRKKKNNKGK